MDNHYLVGGLMAYPSEKYLCLSLGMMTFPIIIWENNMKHVSNHQPVIMALFTLWETPFSFRFRPSFTVGNVSLLSFVESLDSKVPAKREA